MQELRELSPSLDQTTVILVGEIKWCCPATETGRSASANLTRPGGNLTPRFGFFSKEAMQSRYDTLASAGVQLLDDLLRKKGLGETIRLDFFGPLTKDQKKAAITALRKEERFFKHADRDPSDVVAFRPEIIESVLFRGCIGYVRLSEATTRDMALFVAWIALHRSGDQVVQILPFNFGKARSRGKELVQLPASSTERGFSSRTPARPRAG